MNWDQMIEILKFVGILVGCYLGFKGGWNMFGKSKKDIEVDDKTELNRNE